MNKTSTASLAGFGSELSGRSSNKLERRVGKTCRMVVAAFQTGSAYFTVHMNMAEYQLRVVFRNDADHSRLKPHILS
jgi:hypothetical protein